MKSYYCLLTYWVSMTSILNILRRIYHNLFKCNHLKNQKFFLQTSLSFWNWHKFINVLKKKISASQAKCLWYYWLRKTRLLKYLKALVWEHTLIVNVLTSPEHCLNLQEITFFCFIDQSEMNWIGTYIHNSDLKP